MLDSQTLHGNYEDLLVDLELEHLKICLLKLSLHNVQNVTVSGTSITAELRTVTSQSFSGNEVPYVDAGFQDITINQKNYFDTPRMIASKVNEDAQSHQYCWW